MPITPLPLIRDEDEEKILQSLKSPTTVVVRYGFLKQIGEFPFDGDKIIGCGSKLVIKTIRGTEIGEMLTTTCSNSGCGKSVSRQQMLQYFENSGGRDYPFTNDGRALRVATVEDLNTQSKIDAEKQRYTTAAKQAAREMNLPMRIIDCEQMLDRDRIIFYFNSENRVDFRELVRRLASEMHMRIEMRQVGSRDEARIAADYEKCGQQCCCKQFLKVLKPISMRSAKVQKATLDPAKISGRCGRLMCCLRYEDETYEDLRKRLPHRKTRVKTDDGIGTVMDTQILTQLCLVELDSNGKRGAYPLENIEILKGEAAKLPPRPPVEDERPERGERGQRDRGPQRGPRPEPRRPQPGQPLSQQEVESREGPPLSEPVDEEPLLEGDQTPESVDQAEGGQGDGSGAATEGQQAQGEGDGQRRRRRRRRRRRGGGGGGGPSGRPGDQGGPGGPQGGSGNRGPSNPPPAPPLQS